MYIAFVRHGETVGNLEQIAHGQTESPLTDRGREQARATGALLADWDPPFDAIYASPMERAQETARIIGAHIGLDVTPHAGLMEGHLGRLEGLTYAELHEFGFARRSVLDDDFDAHGGESPRVLGRRVADAVQELVAGHAGGRLLMVSHGAAISHCITTMIGESPIFGPQYIMHNGGVTELFLEPRPRIGRRNVVEHMPLALRTAPPQPERDEMPEPGSRQ